MATPVIIEVKANTAQASSQLGSLSKSFKNFGSSVRSVVAMTSQTVTGLRQMAQGVQNLGFTMSAMIGIPLVAGMKKMADATLKFERQMVEVQKTTGMTTDDIKMLSDEIRDLAKATPTSATELATLAAEAGRAGVGLENMLSGNFAAAQAEILDFVRILDMMTISTTLGAEEGARAFGRFITIFDDIDTTNIENLGSAINELGQSSSVTEDEIVGAMMRIAPAAATLGMSAADVAGLATAITQMSESMSRGGTRVRTALEQMVIRWDKAATLIGESSESMKDRIEKDALGVFLEIIQALGEIENSTDRLAVEMELFGTTGANAVQRFVGAQGDLLQLLGISNKAFNEGTSLQIEFNRALGATSEQLKILKNNVVEVGMQFMQDLLPVAKEIIGALIPAVQELGAWVAELSTKQKLMAVGIALLVVVGLPLLALLGSLGFAFTMIVNGLVNVIGGMIGLIATIMTFGGGISFISVALGGLAALLGGVLVVAVLKSLDAFDGIVEKLEEIASGAIDWGEGLIANIAEGIISGAASMLVQAMNFVGDIISNFLEPGSPPKEGPLSTINKWGKRLIDIYLQGFKNADFGILKEITGIIKHVLENLQDLGKIKGVDIGPMLAAARTKVAKLIDIFNKTGEIAQDVLSEIGSMLGEAGDEVMKLLSLQLRYNKALKDLERIRQKKTDIDEAYKAEVRAIMKRTDLTEAEKMNLIRQAKARRNLTQENADTEEKAAKKNVDGLKKQVDWQKKYIQSQMDTDNIWKSQLAMLKKVGKAAAKAAKAIKSMAEKLAEALKKLLDQLAINLKMQEEYAKKGMDTTPLLREELGIRKRIVKNLLAKGDLNAAEQLMLAENLDRIKELDAILKTKKTGTFIPTIDVGDIASASDVVVNGIADMGESVRSFTDILSDGQLAWQAFKDGLMGKIQEPKMPISPEMMALLPKEDIAGIMPVGLTESQVKFYEWGQKIHDVKERVTGTIDEIKTKFAEFKTSIVSAIKGVTDTVRDSDIAGRFAESKSIILPALLAIGGAILLLKGPLSFLAGWSGLGTIFGVMAGGLGKLRGKLGDLGKVAGKAGGKVSGFFGKIGEMTSFLRLGLRWVIAYPKEFAKWVGGGLWSKISAIPKLLGSIGPALKGGLGAIGPAIKGIPALLAGIGPLLSTIGGAIMGGVGAIAGFLSSIAVFVGTIVAVAGGVLAVIAAVGAAVYYIIDNWEKFEDTFKAIWQNIKDAVGGFVESFKTALGVGVLGGKKFADILALIYAKAEPVAKFLAGAFTKALHIISGLLKLLLPALGKAIGGILKGIIAFAAGVLDVFGGVFGVIEAVWDLLTGKGDVSAVGDALKALGTGILEMFGGIAIAVGNVLSGLLDIVLGIFSSIADGLINVFGESKFLQGVKNLVMGIIKWFEELYQKLLGGSIIPDIVNGIKSWFKKIAAPFKPVINAIKKFLGYIKKAAKFIKTAFKAKGMQGGLVAILKVFGPLAGVIKPVIKVIWQFYKIIKPLIDAFKEGFAEGGLTGAFEKIKQVLPTVIPMIGGLLGSLLTMVPKMLAALGGLFIKHVLPAIIGLVTTIYNYLAANLPTWISVFLGVLADLATSIWGWITGSLFPWVVSIVKVVAAYLIKNVPGWVKAFLGVLGTIISALWKWVTGSLIPWAWNMIKLVVGAIIKYGPSLVGGFLEILAKAATALWNWILTDGIPWAMELIKKIIDTIRAEGPGWVAQLVSMLKDAATELMRWVTEDAVPAIEQFIEDGLEVLGKIGGEWLTKITSGLKDLMDKFKEIFEEIRDIIKVTIKAGINKMLTSLEKGINKVIDSINKFIRSVNTLATSLGLGGLPTLKKISIKKLAEGGIATSATLALIGEAGDEAVIPLDKMKNMFNNKGQQPAQVNITIENPIVRNEDDMQKMIDVIQYQLGIKLGTKSDLLGRGMSF